MAHDDTSNSSAVRPDGIAKVTGSARYTTDVDVPRLVHAVIVDSPIACGRVVSIDEKTVLNMPGVLGVLTHANIAAVRGSPPPAWPTAPEELVRSSHQGASLALADERIRRVGQSDAVVIAETLVDAQAAALSLDVQYAPETPKLGLDTWRGEAEEPVSGEIPGGEPASSNRGDCNEAVARSAIIVRATYRSPSAHANPIEPSATLAQWDGDNLVVHDSNQGPHAVRAPLAAALDLPQERVRVISGFVGGAFGCKLQLRPHAYLAALAAKLVGRPVKLVLTRHQMFTGVGHRPELLQDMVLAADRDGRLQAIRHDVVVQTGAVDEFVEGAVGKTRTRYACPNVSTSTKLVHLNMPAGGAMRAPGKNTGAFVWNARWTSSRTHSMSIRSRFATEISPRTIRRPAGLGRAIGCASAIDWVPNGSAGTPMGLGGAGARACFEPDRVWRRRATRSTSFPRQRGLR